jgi:hypothetical protein
VTVGGQTLAGVRNALESECRVRAWFISGFGHRDPLPARPSLVVYAHGYHVPPIPQDNATPAARLDMHKA